jgi:hypothetical protein
LRGCPVSLHYGTNSPRGLGGGLPPAEVEKRLACMVAASKDELIRKVGVWGYLARDSAADPAFDARLISALLRAGLLEPIGMRDDRGRVIRVRVSMLGRRELARRARGAS